LQQVATRSGILVETVADVVDGPAAGTVDVADLRRRLAGGDVALVAITHAPTHNGLVNPAAEIGAACREFGVPFLLDACQSAGQLPLDVTELGCDLLAATGRKWLRGPRGTGFLYVSRALALDPPFVDLRAVTWPTPDAYLLRTDARRFEGFENNVAARIGLGVAVDYALALGLGAIADRVGQLAETLRAGLARQPGCTVLDVGARRSGIVTFSVAGVEPAEVVAAASAVGVTINVATAASARYDVPGVRTRPVVRASPHYYNTADELDRLLASIPLPRTG